MPANAAHQPQVRKLEVQSHRSHARLAQSSAVSAKIKDRDLRQMLHEYQRRLEKVQELVRRYDFAEPIVASDGYTYEKADVSQYITDCKAAGMPAKSKATDVTHNRDFFPNRTLQRMVAEMKAIATPPQPRETQAPTNEPRTAPGSPPIGPMLQSMRARATTHSRTPIRGHCRVLALP